MPAAPSTQRYRRPTQAGWVVSDTKTGSTWSAQSRVRYQYRPTGELLADTVDLFTTTPPGPYSAQVWSFDAQNRQALAWNQTRNAAASRWDSTSRVQYFYTGALKTRDLTQTYAARRFTNQTQTLYAYTGAGQLSILETQTWNPTAPAWGPASRLTYAYDALGRIQQVVSENGLAPATVLANYFRYTYQYNPQNRLSTLLGEIWPKQRLAALPPNPLHLRPERRPGHPHHPILDRQCQHLSERLPPALHLPTGSRRPRRPRRRHRPAGAAQPQPGRGRPG